MRSLDRCEFCEVEGGLDGWTFAGSVLAIGAGAIAVATAPVWGAVGGLCAIAAVGANAMSNYSGGGSSMRNTNGTMETN